MADGCIGDESGNLVFLSVWARDTAIQQFLARLASCVRKLEYGMPLGDLPSSSVSNPPTMFR